MSMANTLRTIGPGECTHPEFVSITTHSDTEDHTVCLLCGTEWTQPRIIECHTQHPDNVADAVRYSPASAHATNAGRLMSEGDRAASADTMSSGNASETATSTRQ